MDSGLLQQFLKVLEVGAPYLRIGRKVRTLSLSPVLDKPGLSQLLDVVGKCGGGYRKSRFQVGAGQFLARRNPLEDFHPHRIPQRFGNLL